MKKIKKYLFNRFGKKNAEARVENDRERRLAFYHNFIESNAVPAGITNDGSSFFNLGYHINGIDDPKDYINGQLTPLFSNLHAKLNSGHLENMAAVETHLLITENELKDIQRHLDPSVENGYLNGIDKKISVFKKNETEMESIAFPEKAFHRVFKNSIVEMEQNIKADTKADPNDLDILKLALTRKKEYAASKQLTLNFRRSLEDLAALRHSLLHPPRLGYIILFYAFCLLLLVAESGLTTRIIHDYMNTGHNWTNSMYSCAYAIGMAAAFAILLKMLIERTLFTSKKYQHWFFIAAIVVIYIVLFILFSHDYKTHTYDYAKGIILSFCSVVFALANAFLFREASYLHHLYYRLNGNQSMIGLKGQRDSFKKRWQQQERDTKSKIEYLISERNIYI